MYFLNSYYNQCVLEPLKHELHTNINSNALKTILVMFVSRCFLLFVASLQHKKSSKYIKWFSTMSHTHLHYNHGVLKLLRHK
jgi:hypothetical protein